MIIAKKWRENFWYYDVPETAKELPEDGKRIEVLDMAALRAVVEKAAANGELVLSLIPEFRHYWEAEVVKVTETLTCPICGGHDCKIRVGAGTQGDRHICAACGEIGHGVVALRRSGGGSYTTKESPDGMRGGYRVDVPVAFRDEEVRWDGKRLIVTRNETGSGRLIEVPTPDGFSSLLTKAGGASVLDLCR